MAEKIGARLFIVAPVLACGALLAGCMSSPTYGTGKSSNEQLLEDVTGMMSLAPKNGQRIDYKPRPELVKPPTDGVLPQPQESVTSAANGAWPEAPEARRKRLRDEATANRDNPFYDSPIDSAAATSSAGAVTRMQVRGSSPSPLDPLTMTPKQQREEYKRRRAEGAQGSPTTRKFLSEPPLVYREASATAPVGDIGEDEWKKEKRAKSAASKKGGLFDWLPF